MCLYFHLIFPQLLSNILFLSRIMLLNSCVLLWKVKITSMVYFSGQSPTICLRLWICLHFNSVRLEWSISHYWQWKAWKKLLILNKCSVDFTSVPKLTLTLQSQMITAQGSVFSLLLFSLEHIVPSIIFGMASPILLFVLYTENIWRLDQKMVDLNFSFHFQIFSSKCVTQLTQPLVADHPILSWVRSLGTDNLVAFTLLAICHQAINPLT